MTTPDPPPATPEPTAPQPLPRRRFLRGPHRRAWMIGGIVLAVIVAAGTVAALLVPDRPGPGHGGPGWAGLRADDRAGGFGFGPGRDGGHPLPGYDGGHPFPGRDGRGWGGGDPVGPDRLGDDTLLSGTVVSAASGSLVLTPDGGAQRTLNTDARARVFGGTGRSVADLTAGQRVVLRVDGAGDAATVVAVWVPRAHVVGTVTALTGDQASVVAVDGRSVAVDLAGVGHRPAVGDLVAVVGGPSGPTLRADELRVLPRTP